MSKQLLQLPREMWLCQCLKGKQTKKKNHYVKQMFLDIKEYLLLIFASLCGMFIFNLVYHVYY